MPHPLGRVYLAQMAKSASLADRAAADAERVLRKTLVAPHERVEDLRPIADCARTRAWLRKDFLERRFRGTDAYIGAATRLRERTTPPSVKTLRKLFGLQKWDWANRDDGAAEDARLAELRKRTSESVADLDYGDVLELAGCAVWGRNEFNAYCEAHEIYDFWTRDYVDGLVEHLEETRSTLGVATLNVVEAGAGDGRLSHLLRDALAKRGAAVNVAATDSGKWRFAPRYPVETADAGDAPADAHVALAAWMPAGADWSAAWRALPNLRESGGPRGRRACPSRPRRRRRRRAPSRVADPSRSRLRSVRRERAAAAAAVRLSRTRFSRTRRRRRRRPSRAHAAPAPPQKCTDTAQVPARRRGLGRLLRPQLADVGQPGVRGRRFGPAAARARRLGEIRARAPLEAPALALRRRRVRGEFEDVPLRAARPPHGRAPRPSRGRAPRPPTAARRRDARAERLARRDVPPRAAVVARLRRRVRRPRGRSDVAVGRSAQSRARARTPRRHRRARISPPPQRRAGTRYETSETRRRRRSSPCTAAARATSSGVRSATRWRGRVSRRPSSRRIFLATAARTPGRRRGRRRSTTARRSSRGASRLYQSKTRRFLWATRTAAASGSASRRRSERAE